MQFQIVLLMEKIVGEMSPKIARLLRETIEDESDHCLDPPNLLQYLDEHLVFLRDNLSAANFDRAIAVLWNCCLDVISEAAQVSSQDRMRYLVDKMVNHATCRKLFIHLKWYLLKACTTCLNEPEIEAAFDFFRSSVC